MVVTQYEKMLASTVAVSFESCAERGFFLLLHPKKRCCQHSSQNHDMLNIQYPLSFEINIIIFEM